MPGARGATTSPSRRRAARRGRRRPGSRAARVRRSAACRGRDRPGAAVASFREVLAGPYSADVPEPSPPLIVLGVRRSGTTLLRVMLDRNPALAVPDESYFVPQLARRHRGVVDAEAFTDDLRRLPTLAEWGLPPDSVAARLRPGMTTGEAIAAVFEAYAAARGKPRWGDKTPLYMQYLPLLERALPDGALRAPDPRRAGRGALVPRRPRGDHDRRLGPPPRRGGVRMPVGHRDPRPRRTSGGAWAAATSRCATRPSSRLRRKSSSACAASPGSSTTTRCSATSERPSRRARSTSSGSTSPRGSASATGARRCPGPTGRRSRRSRATSSHELGYEVAARGHARARLASYRARTAAWRAVGAATQRSPLWRRRHAVLQ